MTLKLTIELVPRTAYGHNLRTELHTVYWDKLRHACYRKASYCCEICGGKGKQHPVECHEIWAYDDEKHVQKLTGLIALCPPCHRVKHFGLAVHAGQGKQAFKQLITVNNITEQAGVDHINQVFAQWLERSEHAWTLDVSWIYTRLHVYDPDEVFMDTALVRSDKHWACEDIPKS